MSSGTRAHHRYSRVRVLSAAPRPQSRHCIPGPNNQLVKPVLPSLGPLRRVALGGGDGLVSELPAEIKSLMDRIVDKRIGYQPTIQVMGGLRAHPPSVPSTLLTKGAPPKKH
jgi:hypothetical protein